MNSTKWMVLILLLLTVTLHAQKKAVGFLSLPDSTLRVWQVNFAPDSLAKSSPLIITLPAGPTHLKLIYYNNRLWNNWAIDTSLTIPVADTLFLHSLPGTRSAAIHFTTIPLNLRSQGQPSFKQLLKPGLAAITVVSHWASFYLKRQADDSYRQYRHTSNLHEINAFYRKTQRLDTLSNLLLGVSTVSLSAFLFMLIKGS